MSSADPGRSDGRTTLAEQLRRALIARGWTETELAQKAGVSLNTISAALHGSRPTVATFGRITQAFASQPVTEAQRAAVAELFGNTGAEGRPASRALENDDAGGGLGNQNRQRI